MVMRAETTAARAGSKGPGRLTPSPAVTAGLQAVRAQPMPSRDELKLVVEGVVASLSGDLTAADLRLYTELEALARFIQAAKSEIAAVHPDTMRREDIPRAADELDAVVGATEDATNRIMDTCEQLQTLAGGLDGPIREQIEEACTTIFEACNFQDVTGQRISKVVRTLKHIESRIEMMLEAFGEEVARLQAEPPPPPPAPVGDAALLNGPQMPASAKGQAEIDAIFASFG